VPHFCVFQHTVSSRVVLGAISKAVAQIPEAAYALAAFREVNFGKFELLVIVAQLVLFLNQQLDDGCAPSDREIGSSSSSR